jgi:hypothetical protein
MGREHYQIETLVLDEFVNDGRWFSRLGKAFHMLDGQNSGGPGAEPMTLKAVFIRIAVIRMPVFPVVGVDETELTRKMPGYVLHPGKNRLAAGRVVNGEEDSSERDHAFRGATSEPLDLIASSLFSIPLPGFISGKTDLERRAAVFRAISCRQSPGRKQQDY